MEGNVVVEIRLFDTVCIFSPDCHGTVLTVFEFSSSPFSNRHLNFRMRPAAPNLDLVEFVMCVLACGYMRTMSAFSNRAVSRKW